MRIFGVILAGGSGRRLGGVDKALLPLAGQPLITHLQDRLGPQVEELAIAANGDPARLGFTGLPVLPDGIGAGPLAGVLAGLGWAAAQGADALVSAAVDLPFLPCDLVPRLWMAADGGLAVAECGGRSHPTCALWPVAIIPELQAYLAAGEARVMGFATAQGAAAARFAGGEPDPFLNLNTPEDLARAAAALAP